MLPHCTSSAQEFFSDKCVEKLSICANLPHLSTYNTLLNHHIYTKHITVPSCPAYLHTIHQLSETESHTTVQDLKCHLRRYRFLRFYNQQRPAWNSRKHTKIVDTFVTNQKFRACISLANPVIINGEEPNLAGLQNTQIETFITHKNLHNCFCFARAMRLVFYAVLSPSIIYLLVCDHTTLHSLHSIS